MATRSNARRAAAPGSTAEAEVKGETALAIPALLDKAKIMRAIAAVHVSAKALDKAAHEAAFQAIRHIWRLGSDGKPCGDTDPLRQLVYGQPNLSVGDGLRQWLRRHFGAVLDTKQDGNTTVFKLKPGWNELTEAGMPAKADLVKAWSQPFYNMPEVQRQRARDPFDPLTVSKMIGGIYRRIHNADPGDFKGNHVVQGAEQSDLEAALIDAQKAFNRRMKLATVEVPETPAAAA